MDAGSARPCGRGGRWTVRGLASAGLALWALCATAQAAERVALVIGNGAYKHVPFLANPGNDAKDVGTALDRLGFTVTRLADADQATLRQRLRDFTRAAGAAEVAVVFYAGHGLEVDGRNFLVPVDARLASDQDVEFETVPLELVMRAVERARGLRLVVLDACRDNPFAESMQRAGATRSIGRGLARAEPRGETLVAYAAKGGSTAADGDGRNSPYTGALLRYLEEPGLDVGRMFRKVRDEVLAATGGRQEPFVYGSMPGRDVYLASAAASPSETTATPTIGGTPSPSGDAARAYEAAERLNTVAAYRIVVKRFPGTIEAELAQAWMDKHEQAPRVVAGGGPEAVEQGLRLSREDRRLVQRGLAAAGHDPGPADGMIGRGTREAIRRWQGARGQAATGYLDADGAKALLALGEREAEEMRRAEARRKRVGTVFRDCPECPEMVVVPAGRFRMGSTSGDDDERPVHPVTIARPFAVGVYEVTFAEWDACVSDGGCGRYRPSDSRWGRGVRPVMNVSWNDAKAYVRWLSGRTGEAYRLLSGAEWEYVARAGTTTAYWWGNDIGRSRANCRGCGSRWDGKQTAPVGSFLASPFELHDVHGNVQEWVEDCWNDSYHGAPRDGSAWTSEECGRRVVRGGSWFGFPWDLRSADRNLNPTGDRISAAGFRVARTLTP